MTIYATLGTVRAGQTVRLPNGDAGKVLHAHAVQGVAAIVFDVNGRRGRWQGARDTRVEVLP